MFSLGSLTPVQGHVAILGTYWPAIVSAAGAAAAPCARLRRSDPHHPPQIMLCASCCALGKSKAKTA